MNPKMIAAIASTADNGCSYCINDLRDKLETAFPELKWKFLFDQAAIELQIVRQFIYALEEFGYA